MEDEGLSIEETNALRAKLGLKPLNIGPQAPAAGASSEGGALSTEQQDAIAADNYKRKQAEARQAKEQEAARDRIRKARERAERQKLLVGKTLGEEDDGEDTLTWIKRTKTLAPAKPVKVQAVRPSYDSKELAGLKVGHDLDDVQGGSDVILTLKDGGVLDEDVGDELVNVAIAEQERTKQRLDSKKRKSVYAPGEEEMDESGERKILACYDEEMDGPSGRSAGFIIDAQGETQKVTAKPPVFRSRKVESLDAPAVSVQSSDYTEEVKLKKRKRKEKSLRKRDDQEAPLSFNATGKTQTIDGDLNFVDDDDLQASLARQRRLNTSRRMQPEDIAASLISKQAEPSIASASSGLVIDDASEFTRSIMSIQLPEPKPERSQSAPVKEDVVMNDAAENSAVADESVTAANGIGEEATLNQGIGAAMKLLLQKGVITRNQEEQDQQHEKEAWLAQDRKVRLELELERKHAKDEIRRTGVWDKMSQRDREAWAANENKRLDALEARLSQERFKHYKPKVDLKYVDDFGRNMNQKEAFKHLSHQFHGKDSGSGKTAKKLAKIEKEKLAEQRTIFR